MNKLEEYFVTHWKTKLENDKVLEAKRVEERKSRIASRSTPPMIGYSKKNGQEFFLTRDDDEEPCYSEMDLNSSSRLGINPSDYSKTVNGEITFVSGLEEETLCQAYSEEIVSRLKARNLIKVTKGIVEKTKGEDSKIFMCRGCGGLMCSEDKETTSILVDKYTKSVFCGTSCFNQWCDKDYKSKNNIQSYIG